MAAARRRGSPFRRTPSQVVFDVANVVVLLLVVAVMLLPMVHVLNVSISEGQASVTKGFFLLPRGQVSLLGYETVMKDPLLLRSYLNSVLYAVGGVLVTLFMTSLTAYPLSVPGFVLRKPVTIFLTIPMFIGGGLIPTYLLIRSLHLVNTYWVMVIPFCVSNYNVVLFRTFFSGEHSALREAAVIDGASEFGVFIRLYVPLSKAIFATIGLFTLVGKWNDWFSALIYLNDQSLYPLQMILRQILFNLQSVQQRDPDTMTMLSSMKVTNENIKMAAILITSIPVLCAYPFLQRFFVKGVFIGTLKG